MLKADLFSFFDGIRLNVINPLEDLWKLIQELLEYTKTLKLGWDGVLALLDGASGRTFPKRMVREIRSCDDSCECGRYPTTAGGRYPPGLGVVGIGSTIVAPVHGIVTAAGDNYITISPIDQSWGALISIYNIRPDVIVNDIVYAGKRVGSLYNRKECGRYWSYHISMRELPRAGAAASKAHYVDPTDFVHVPQSPPPLSFAIECDEVSKRDRGLTFLSPRVLSSH